MRRPLALRRAVPRLTLAALLALLAGCAAASRQSMSVGEPVIGRPRIAVLPLEDLSGQVDAAVGFWRLLFAEVVRTRRCEVVESGIVEQVLDSLSIRDGGSLTREQIRLLGDRLQVEYLLTGSFLESAMVKTGDGEVPSAGATLKLVEVATARAVWAESRFHTGEDRETVFGWGRERDPQRVAASLASLLIKDFTVLTADTTASLRRKTK